MATAATGLHLVISRDMQGIPRKGCANVGEDCSERPILFAAHDLGDIIVKDVSRCKLIFNRLTNPRSVSSEDSEIRSRTLGIMPRDKTRGIPWNERKLSFAALGRGDALPAAATLSALMTAGHLDKRPPIAPIIVDCIEDTSTPTPTQ